MGWPAHLPLEGGGGVSLFELDSMVGYTHEFRGRNFEFYG